MKLKYVFIGLSLILLILFAAILIFGESWVEKKLRNEITKIEGLHFDTLKINMPQRELYLGGIEFDRNEINVRINSLEIKGIALFRYFISGTLPVDTLSISNPSITIIRGTEELQRDSAKTKEGKRPLPSLNISYIHIKKGTIGLKRLMEDSVYIRSDFDIKLSSLELDDETEVNSILENIDELRLASMSYNTPDGLFIIRGAELNVFPADNYLVLKNVTVKSLYEKYELGPALGHEFDWMDIETDSVSIVYESFSKLTDKKIVRSIDIYRPILQVFRDKRLPFPEDNRPKILMEILAMDSLSFGIDSLRIHDGDIVYQEFVKRGVGPGEITLNHLDVTISDLYTYNLQSTRSPRLRGSFKIMNAGQVYADIVFPDNINGKTLMKGKMGEMNLTRFNKMLQYVAFMKVKSGMVRSCDFEFSYDRKLATGEMMLNYDDLKIEMLNRNDIQSSGFLQNLEGFVANTFVVHENNKHDSSFRVGKIEYQRNEKKSMFNYWVKSIFSGLLSSTGVKKKEKKIDMN